MQTCNHLQSVHLSRFISSHFPPWLRYSSPPISPFLVMYWYIFTPIQKKGNAKKYSNHPTIVLISYVSEEMLKILQARLQQYVNQEISHVQGRLGKGRGTRDKTVHICWIIEKGKTREFQKKEKHLLLLHWLCLWWCGSQQTVENSSRDGNTRPPYLPTEKPVCRSRSQQLELDMGKQTGSKLEKEYVKATYCHPAYLTYRHSTSCEKVACMKNKLEQRLLEEISITSYMQMTPPLW